MSIVASARGNKAIHGSIHIVWWSVGGARGWGGPFESLSHTPPGDVAQPLGGRHVAQGKRLLIPTSPNTVVGQDNKQD